MDNSEQTKIKENHPVSYDGIFHGHSWKDIRDSKPFLGSIILSITLIGVSYFSSRNLYEILKLWTENVVAIIPNLLGFTLGGYALIIGFGNTDLIEALTKTSPQKPKNSVFQRLNSIFAFSIILNTWTFSIALVTHFLIEFNFTTSNLYLYYCVNFFLILLISISWLWSIFMLPNLVANVFTFGQLHHFHLVMKRIKKEEEIKKEKEQKKVE